LLALTLALLLASEFARCPAESRLSIAPAAVDLSTPKARRFRTVLREAAAKGPNFNGHYRVVHWGCGSNCIEWAVVDLVTGQVWFAPDEAASCWALHATEPQAVQDWLEYRVDSSLLYLHQCDVTGLTSDRAFDTRHVYAWREGKLHLIRKERLAP
jgi:hypothetical protein